MGLLVNDRKLKAAAFSMHQFCQEVRCIFPGDVDDRVIEAATVYLYVSLARDLFGHRFAIRLQKRLRGSLKYSTPAEVEGHVARIARQSESLEKEAASQATERTPEEVCRAHTEAVIEAMLADAGFQDPAEEDATKAYIKFEAAIRVIRKHLVGIKEQNYFLMKSKPLT
jgi:hypothetical protein